MQSTSGLFSYTRQEANLTNKHVKLISLALNIINAISMPHNSWFIAIHAVRLL